MNWGSTSEGGAQDLLASRVSSLDGLRGYAILLVLGFHARFGVGSMDVGAFRGGFVGVDLFLVISGFLITMVLIPQGRPPLRLTVFWRRRVRRLLPAMAALVVASAAAGPFVLHADERQRLFDQLWFGATNSMNWFSALGDYKDASFVSHTWSLALEWQWYLLWSVAVIGITAAGGSRRLLLYAAMAGTALVAAWRLVLFAEGVALNRLYFGFDTRLDGFLMGAVVALLLQTEGLPRTAAAKRVPRVLGAVGFGIVIWAGTTQSVVEAFWYRSAGFTVVALASAAVVHHAVVGDRGPFLALLKLPPVVALGRISYSVYLWHWPVFLLTSPERMGWSPLTANAIRVPATIVLSIASYALLERHAVKHRRVASSITSIPVPAPA